MNRYNRWWGDGAALLKFSHWIRKDLFTNITLRLWRNENKQKALHIAAAAVRKLRIESDDDTKDIRDDSQNRKGGKRTDPRSQCNR